MARNRIGLGISIFALSLEFISIFVFWWLAIIGTFLGIIAIFISCYAEDKAGTICSIIAIVAGIFLAVIGGVSVYNLQQSLK